MSSGHRTLFGEVACWIVLAGVMAAGVTHLEDLKAFASRLVGANPPQLAVVKMDDAPAAADAAASAGGLMVELPLGSDGHYHAEAEINGRSVQVLVDTGASLVALTAEDAETAGVFVSDKDFTHRIQTANGTARVAPVALDRVAIGEITIRDVRGVVMEPGAMSVSLLGMTFLNELERVDMRQGKLILQD